MRQETPAFTNHAVYRTKQRTTLTPMQLLSIIHHKLAVSLGIDVGTTKQRWLVWSPNDQAYFVAIQDTLSGDVITVLTLEYNENFAGKVAVKYLDEAKALLPTLDTLHLKNEIVQPKAQHFVVACLYLDTNQKQLVKKLYGVSKEDYESVEDYIARGLDRLEVQDAVVELGIDFNQVTGVSIRLGKKGVPVWVDIANVQ